MILYFILRKKCPHSELFWSAFSRIRTEYGEIRIISLYRVRLREIQTRITPNTDTFYTVLCSYKIHPQTLVSLENQFYFIPVFYYFIVSLEILLILAKIVPWNSSVP